MNYPIYKEHFDFEALVVDIKEYLPDFDEERFRKAFDFAEQAHLGQMRKDNETPYIFHPVSVVKLLTKLRADEDILISAMLHDVPEDTKHDIAEVKKLFGETVAFLVDGITKLSKVHYQNNMPERQIESLKKLFLHSAKDPRVVIIKLADRLHNMQTLQHVAPHKRERIAKETLEIFVPMANLLGIQSLKSKLEDLCFKYLFPDEYEKLREILKSKKEKNTKFLKRFISSLNLAFKKIGLPVDISERKQNLYTIFKNLSSNGRTFDDLRDVIAVRIIVDTIPHCYEALGIVHGMYTPKIDKFKDYIANPKINKYQSIHTVVFGVDGILTEVQIRNKKMHLEAKYGIASNFFMEKKKKIDKDIRSLWMSKIIEIDRSDKPSSAFIEDLKCDILQDRISVFTPKGEKIDLPRGASAIDFAFALESNVGINAEKAEVNGILMPITTALKTGDVVKINTKDYYFPSLSWLPFIKTNLARINVLSYLKKIKKEQKVSNGHKLLQKEFDIAGLGLLKNHNFKKLNAKLLDKFGKSFDSLDALLIAIGEGGLDPITIVNSVKKSPEDLSPRGMKINVKVFAKNRFGLMKEVYEIFYKFAQDMTYFKAWASSRLKDAFFNVQIVVRDPSTIGHIFNELEQIEEVKSVYRVPNRELYLTYTLIGLTISLWLFHPFILRIVFSIEGVNPQDFLFRLLVNAGLFALLLLIMYITNLLKNFVPYIRNKKLFWGGAFGIPFLAGLIFLFDFFYFEFYLSWEVLVLELFIVYVYLFLSFWTFKKKI